MQGQDPGSQTGHGDPTVTLHHSGAHEFIKQHNGCSLAVHNSKILFLRGSI